jgi:hypothetical protein
MQARFLFPLTALLILAVPTISFAQSCTPEQIVACARKGTSNLCTGYSCVPHKPRFRGGSTYSCVLGNKLDGTNCSNTVGCVPYGNCSQGTCVGPHLACAPQPGQPASTVCLCSMFKCSALNFNNGHALNASQVCTAQPVPSRVWLPE